MDLDRYVSELQAQLAAAVEIGDADARAVAERLSVALDAGTRLMVLGVLSDVASDLTQEIAPGSIELVLRGRDPVLVVSRSLAPDADSPAPPAVSSPDGAAEPLDDTVSSRTTLRLPDRLKTRVEQAAAEEGVSVNSWFVRAIAAALEPSDRRGPRRESKADRFTGWAR